MLSRSNRLPAVEVTRVMKYGKRVVGEGLTLIYKKASGGLRAAFIVSTKVDKRATVRNRMRRIISESVRHMIGDLALTGDIVIIGSKPLIGLSQAEVEGRVKKLLEILS